MRVLMLSTPVPSHLAPLIALAWALRAAGHDLLVAGQPDVLPTARSAGLSVACLGDPFHVDDLLFEGLPEGTRPLWVRPRPAPEVLGSYGRVWLAHARYLLPRYLPFARAWRPDLILSDPLEYSALMLGGVLDVPVVQHRWGVDAISGPARRTVRPAMAGIGQRLGVGALPDPTVLVDPCPPSLQLPGVEPGVPMRYVPFNGSGVLPGWLHAEREGAAREGGAREGGGGQRRVVVSLGGTLLLNGVPFVRTILWAFDEMPGVRVLATVAPEFRAVLGQLPGNVELIDPTPLDLFLDTCDAVVHHGGAGTTMTATSFGLPQLVLPQLADHFAHGDRIAAVGAGIAFDTAAEQDDPGRLRESLAALLFEPGYRKAAGELRREMRCMPSPAAVVADLERLVSAARPGAGDDPESHGAAEGTDGEES
jgi:UDP:flavonoid glycosyltransferase YjiC (YdhE family)